MEAFCSLTSALRRKSLPVREHWQHISGALADSAIPLIMKFNREICDRRWAIANSNLLLITG